MDLSALTKPQLKAPQITIVGTPGVGKSTLAAMFPAAIFAQAEDGSSVFDSWDEDAKPTMFPALRRAVAKDGKLVHSTKDQLIEQLRALATQEHDFKTLVLDSVTSLHSLFEHEVCESYGVDNIGEAAGGYGKGFLAVKEMHAEVKDACDYLRSKKDMAVIFLAHAGIKKIRHRPDAEEHSVYSLDMHDGSIPIYVNLVDAVLYLRQEEFIKGRQEDRKGNTTKFGKIVQTGERVLVTSGDGKIGFANAKNRYELPAELPVERGTNPLIGLIPYFKTKE
jgi:hypothetical protein